jgi:hypothetical protein
LTYNGIVIFNNGMVLTDHGYVILDKGRCELRMVYLAFLTILESSYLSLMFKSSW